MSHSSSPDQPTVGTELQPDSGDESSSAADEPPTATPEESRESSTGDLDSQQRARIEALLDQWELSLEAGSPIPVETLCGSDPELTPAMRDRIAALQEVDKRLAERQQRQESHTPMPTLSMGSTIHELKFLNSGGLGEVFVGEDEDLHRQVAVKFMHGHLCSNEELRGQFALEAEITGRLEHPGVVPLYGAGCTDDRRPFYAMRYIEGQTLDQAIKRYFKLLNSDVAADHEGSQQGDGGFNEEIEFRRLLNHFITVCKTIAYAHNRGVVHRDIKPANVMIGRFGETIVVDWGLSVPVMRDERFRVSGEETLAISPGGSSGSGTARGSGTPAFMSPEQFSEQAPSPTNDIYSLGATLFVILCGKPPIRNKSLSDIRNDRIEGRHPIIDEIRKGVPKRLQAIAYKSMSKEAKDRYPTALDLARDVERYMADEPVSAYHDSIGLRVARLARRHRSAAQATVLGLLACFVIAGCSAVLMGGLANRHEKLRDHNLTTSAQFIARSCGYEIDRIWRVMEYEANAPEVKRLVAQANQLVASGEQITLENQTELQDYLESRLQQLQNVPTIDKIVVLAKRGTQAARAPLPESPQIGQNFAYRDYFTGMGFDLEAGSRIVSMIDEPLAGPAVYPSGVHMSPAYISTLNDKPMVTLTVPIHAVSESGEREVIGIVGTSIAVGAVMSATRIDDSNTWIADLREDELEETRKRGLILHYPTSVDSQDRTTPHRLSNDLVESLRQSDFEYSGRQLSENWLIGTNDHYSIQPITISGRNGDGFDLGWIVITAESEQE